MRVTFWGTRGSVPTPGPSTVRYGGNTACVEMRTDGGTFFIFDSGTGIRELGLNLTRQGRPVTAHLMLGHTHWDHISGFAFFTPAFVPGNRLAIYGARDVDRSSAIGIAQTHEGKVELQQRDQGVGESGCHGRRVPAGPYSRDRRKRDEIPQRGLQAEELGVGIDVHLVRNAGAGMRLLLP